LRELGKRRTSPTQATKVAAVIRLTPGTVSSRRISVDLIACSASSRSRRSISSSSASTWRRHPSTVTRSSAGKARPASQRRPARPKRSL